MGPRRCLSAGATAGAALPCHGAAVGIRQAQGEGLAPEQSRCVCNLQDQSNRWHNSSATEFQTYFVLPMSLGVSLSCCCCKLTVPACRDAVQTSMDVFKLVWQAHTVCAQPEAPPTSCRIITSFDPNSCKRLFPALPSQFHVVRMMLAGCL